MVRIAARRARGRPVVRRRHRDDPGLHDSATGRARRRAHRQRRGCGTDPGWTGRVGTGITGASALPHLRGGWARPQFSCSRNGLTLPQLHRDWAHPSPHLHRDRARACHICAGTERASASSGAGTGRTPQFSCSRNGLTPSQLRQDLGLPLTASAPGLGLAPPNLRRGQGI